MFLDSFKEHSGLHLVDLPKADGLEKLAFDLGGCGSNLAGDLTAPKPTYADAQGWKTGRALTSMSRKVQASNISGLWFQTPYLSWFLGAGSLNVGYLDPLRSV